MTLNNNARVSHSLTDREKPMLGKIIDSSTAVPKIAFARFSKNVTTARAILTGGNSERTGTLYSILSASDGVRFRRRSSSARIGRASSTSD